MKTRAGIFLIVLLTPWMYSLVNAQCKLEKDGSCPPTSMRMCTDPNAKPECNCDIDCPQKKKCCRDICVNICKDPVKPGYCPVPSTMCSADVPEPTCQSDYDCGGEMKCCTPFCRQECTKPVN
ncbi:antileukoproteinase [Microcaecilia unicolor]|uniref:Antileukoproteinase-like n=1 Tax=Microcaecilia unicolor TaxID=1415580 RepID=A0A6P7WN54_9AMPH|nr:antileukoproteinase-like [Microcaecilia unicolor]